MTHPFVEYVKSHRRFEHHVTGRTILRDLNVPGHKVREYHLPWGPEDTAALGAIVAYCLLVGESE